MNLFATNIIGPMYWDRDQTMTVNGLFIMLSVVAFYLIINRILTKKPLKFPLVDDLDLDRYTFGFEETHVKVKTISLPTRITIYLISALVIITPLSELLQSTGFYDSIWAVLL